MGCSGSKSVSNRVIPMPVDADANDTTAVALNQVLRCLIILNHSLLLLPNACYG